MTTPLLANAELVARHWLLAQDFIDSNVATTLPDVPWPNDEFVHIVNVGGTPDRDNPLMSSVVSFTCYAMRHGSTKPPWGKANQLAMKIVMACWAQTNLYAPDPRVALDLPSSYGRTLVQSVWPVSEVRRAPADPSQYAAFNVDIQLVWTPAEVVIP